MQYVQPVILVAEDDQNDVQLLQWAFTRAALKARVHYVGDGIEAIEFLADSAQNQVRCCSI
jgi:CheY-like chemotaxis protein